MGTKRKLVIAPLVAKAAAIRVLQEVIASNERPTGPQLRARIRESSEHGAMIADNRHVLGHIINQLGVRMDQIASTAMFEHRRSEPRKSPSTDRLAAIEQTLVLMNHKLHRIVTELGVPDA